MNEYNDERKWVDAGRRIWEIMSWWFGKDKAYREERDKRLNDAVALMAWDRIISHDKPQGRDTVKYYADWHEANANDRWNSR